MSLLKIAASVMPSQRIDSVPVSDTWECHTVRCVTRWGRSGAVISVDGELDASNADQLAGFLQQCAAYCEWLVLDLSDLEFIGTAGFSALSTTTGRCSDAGIYCTTVPGQAVTRLLRICDPTNALPTSASVSDALSGVQGLRKVR
ncbi:hypothetical protein MTER_09860 [Mycolicibacter terrae]|uniref:STAS domain-containing protein n=1 Tax=Mycolicibacter terrae TaxID=1788 RepID=A0AAD1HVD9_9MYCO|nr:hypothetical protein MTER_09860 [Mycolicibacter terrae]SNV87850.1 anti-sigma-factor antagonist [Mycolicibacter terrae]